MFGLLRVPKGYLSETEYQIFQAHYCGICHSLGRCGFQGLRFATSYDGAALALFVTALSDSSTRLERRACPVAPWRKKYQVADMVESFDFVAAASLAVADLKLADELQDEQAGELKSTALKILHRYLQRKAPNWPELKEVAALQQAAEQGKEPWFDELSLPSGLLLGSIAARAAAMHKQDQSMAFAVGENLGKWIYTWDCLWDYNDDQAADRFNGLASAYGVQSSVIHAIDSSILAEMDFVLERCLAEILRNLELLQLGRNGELLAKLILGAHNWHKRAFVKEFFKEGYYERLPSTWRPNTCSQASSNGGGVGNSH